MSVSLPRLAVAEVAACRTEWEQHDGLGIQTFSSEMGSHGQIEEYAYATIPDPYGAGWFAAPDGQSIDYDLNGNSTMCGSSVDCRYGGEFTYFKTHIYLPPSMAFTEAWIDVDVVDDGVRMTVFAPSTPPEGVTDPGGYAFLGGGVSSDLLPYMTADPWSVVVLTHVDDCCSAAYIRGVEFVVNIEGRGDEALPTDCDLSDDDGDGFPPAGGDCDDEDPTLYPGAPELPDGIDNDCDGVVDEETDLHDDDADGFSEQEGDCNDNSSLFHPDADEVCDQHDLDYDCDGCPGSTDPDCGGDCGASDDDDDDDAGDDDSAANDDDSGSSGGDEAGAFLPEPGTPDSSRGAVGCNCNNGDDLTTSEAGWTGLLLCGLPLLGRRRRRAGLPPRSL